MIDPEFDPKKKQDKTLNTGNYNMLTGVDSFPVKRFKGRGNRRFKVKKDDNDDEVI